VRAQLRVTASRVHGALIRDLVRLVRACASSQVPACVRPLQCWRAWWPRWPTRTAAATLFAPAASSRRLGTARWAQAQHPTPSGSSWTAAW